MNAIVLDFTGLYVNGVFVIKEFCKAHITPRTIKVYEPLLIDTSSINITGDLIREFYERCSIPWQVKSEFTSSSLLLKLRAHMGSRCDVYVRDIKHAEMMRQYLGLSYIPFKALFSLDKSLSVVVMKTICKNHDRRDSYCVKDNVRKMAQLLKKKLSNPSGVKDNHAVVHFTGFYSLGERFQIKEFCVYCLDNQGTTVYNQLMVAILPNYKTKLHFEMLNYQRNYYEKFGIEWQAGNCGERIVQQKIRHALLSNKVGFVYVKNNARRDILQPLIGSDFEIICLDQYNFVESLSVSHCRFHTHHQEENNNCALPRAKDMVRWLLREQLFRQKIRDDFERSSRLIFEDSDSTVDP